MAQISVEKNVANIEGLCVITPTVHYDGRGFFQKRIMNVKCLKMALQHVLFRITSQCLHAVY